MLREQLVLKGLFDIVYGRNIIVNDLNNVCECDFNENFYCNEYDCGVLLSPYPTPIPGAPIVDFINSRAEIREQLVVKDLFDIVNEIIIENFCNNGYCCPTPTPAPTPQIIIIFNNTGVGISGIDTGLCENDILDSIFGVNNNENDIVNEICNEMNNAGI